MDDSVASPAEPSPRTGFYDQAVPLVSVHRADNGDLVIVINGRASAADVMMSLLQAMGPH